MFVVNPTFPLGQLVMTRGVNDLVADDEAFAKFITESLNRHVKGDWENLTDEDKQENKLSLGELPKIWIITEADRSATTILFPDEY